MRSDHLNEKIVLVLSFLILNNYLFLSLGLSQLLLKINFIVFLLFVLIFYFKNFFEHIFLKIFFLIIVLISLGVPTIEWDPRSIYLFHAKRIFYDNSIFSIADGYASFSHNEYPTLVPAFASSFAILIGHWNEVFPKLSFTLMFFPPLILALSFMKNTKYLIFLSIVFFIISKYLFNGWTDGLVAIYFCLSSFLVYFIFIDENNPYRNKLLFYLLTYCFFVTLTLIKNEGSVLLVILFITTFFLRLRQKKVNRNFLKIFLLLLLSFVPILLWKIFCYTKGISHEFIHSSFFQNLLARSNDFDNYKQIFYFLILNEKFLLSLIFFSVSFWINKNWQIFNFVTIISLLYLFVLFLIYLSTPYDFYFQLDSTAARVIKTLSFFIACFGLLNLNIIRKKF